MFKKLCAVSVFLAVFLFSAAQANAATFYWYSASESNANWDTVSNWWTDSAHTKPAGILPGPSDTVITKGTVGPVATRTIQVNSINASATGMTFNSGGVNNSNITGNVVFNGNSYNYSEIITDEGPSPVSNVRLGMVNQVSCTNCSKKIKGNVLFKDTSYNAASIEGNVTFFDKSRNDVGRTEVVSILRPVYDKYDGEYLGNVTDKFPAKNKITGNVTVVGDFANVAPDSSISGTRTRIYKTSIATARDFITGGPWIVIADGAVVNVVGAKYDAKTKFQTLNGGSFAYTYTGLAPTVTITASKTSVRPYHPGDGGHLPVLGEDSNITWSSTNATNCSASGAWTGPVETSGTYSTGKYLTATSTYSVTCLGLGGSVTSQVTIGIASEQPTITISASPAAVYSGDSSTITWSSSNVRECSNVDYPYTIVASSSSKSTGPLTKDYTYSIHCSGWDGTSVTATARVTIIKNSGSISIKVIDGNFNELPNKTVGVKTIFTEVAPASISNVPVGTHSVYSTISAYYDTTVATCTYPEGGAACTIPNKASYSKLNLNCLSTGYSCDIPVNITNDMVTKVVFMQQYSASSVTPFTGEIMVKRVDSTLKPVANTQGKVDNLAASSLNPAEVMGLSPGMHTAATTQLSNHDVYVATCSYALDGSPECTLPIAPGQAGSNYSRTNVTCENGICSVPVSVQAKIVTKVVFAHVPSGTSIITPPVIVPPVITPNAPTVDIDISSDTVNPGDSATLTWSSTGAEYCMASGSWSGRKGVSGSISVGPLTRDSRFVLKCTNKAGVTKSAQAAVTVQSAASAAPSITLTASPSTVSSGQSSTITWTTENVTSCDAWDSWIGRKATSGSWSTGPLTSAKGAKYTLSCTGPSGGVTEEVDVAVTGATEAPLTVLPWSNAPSSVAAGSSFSYKLNWSGGPIANTTPDQWQIFVVYVSKSNAYGPQIPTSNFLPAQPASTWSGSTQISNSVSVPANQVPGAYDVYVGLFHSSDQVRAELEAGDGVTTNGERMYRIGEITVTAPVQTSSVWDALKAKFGF